MSKTLPLANVDVLLMIYQLCLSLLKYGVDLIYKRRLKPLKEPEKSTLKNKNRKVIYNVANICAINDVDNDNFVQ